MSQIALCSAVPMSLSGGAVPSWLHLLPAGEIRTNDGRGPYRVADAAQLAAESIAAGKLTICENHATDLAAPLGKPAPARGWIVELQSRADGIWGRVEWTGQGREIVADRQYRGVSPVIVHNKAGAIIRVLRATLTNTPNLAGLVSLHSQGAMTPVERAALLPILRHHIAGLRDKVASLDASSSIAGKPGVLDAADHEIVAKLGLDASAYIQTRDGVAMPPELDDADRDMIARLGVDPAAYAAAKLAGARE